MEAMQITTPVASSRPSKRQFVAEAFDFRFNQAPNERLFTALCEASADTGGVACGDDLAPLMADYGPGVTNHRLARLIANEDLFYFQWRGAKWIPMVQFHLDDLSINNFIRKIRRELGDDRDGWEAASWFVCPNDWLSGQRPVDLVDRDPDA
ncbi:MAG: hypothetical protein M3Z16_04400, partial [Pseudomonadota bacterium]|nr:hypothetical protein [Pseudomonadota bacterium]